MIKPKARAILLFWTVSTLLVLDQYFIVTGCGNRTYWLKANKSNAPSFCLCWCDHTLDKWKKNLIDVSILAHTYTVYDWLSFFFPRSKYIEYISLWHESAWNGLCMLQLCVYTDATPPTPDVVPVLLFSHSTPKDYMPFPYIVLVHSSTISFGIALSLSRSCTYIDIYPLFIYIYISNSICATVYLRTVHMANILFPRTKPEGGIWCITHVKTDGAKKLKWQREFLLKEKFDGATGRTARKGSDT